MNYVYDIETYPNVFTFACQHVETGNRWYFEISERRNDIHEFVAFLYALRDCGASMVGFNNLHFDYPVIHHIIQNYPALMHAHPLTIAAFIFTKVDEIFNASNRFGHTIWQPIIRQIDLFKIHHFDNRAKSTSLKVLEFNMRSDNISDLPFTPGTNILLHQLDTLMTYNMHDVAETVKFFNHTKPMIDFRDKISAKYDKDFTNHNDTKIGKDYFIMRLEEHAPGTCFYKGNDGYRKPHQTSRPNGVALREIIFPYVKFMNPEFNRILNWMQQQTLSSKEIESSTTMGIDTKGVFKGVNCVVDGLRYDFGTGGIHGSMTNTSVYADDEYAIVDLDVASYYPNLAIVNRLFPQHLGDTFCAIYKDVYEQRKTYSKKTVENGMLKLALNGVYGDSNNVYSPFFDPQYTMSITINGQLLLCMLAEALLFVPRLKVIQINTDGLTVILPRVFVSQIDGIKARWESLTGLELEAVNYAAMHIRDVNNYIGVYEDGGLKTKGAYESKQPQDRKPLGWHQNMSALIVPKAATEHLVNGVGIDEFIRSPERDFMDFMLRAKVQRSCSLVAVDHTGSQEYLQNTSRYFIATHGPSLFKLSPPTKPHVTGTFKKAQGITDAEYNRYDPYTWNPAVHTKNQGRYDTRKDSISAGWKVNICNDIRDANRANLNYDYYVAEAEKLVRMVRYDHQ